MTSSYDDKTLLEQIIKTIQQNQEKLGSPENKTYGDLKAIAGYLADLHKEKEYLETKISQDRWKS